MRRPSRQDAGVSDAEHLRLLCARRERPGGRCAAGQQATTVGGFGFRSDKAQNEQMFSGLPSKARRTSDNSRLDHQYTRI